MSENKEILDLSDDEDVFNISFMDDSIPESKYNADVESIRKQLDEEKRKTELLVQKFNKFLNNLKSDPDKPTIKWPNRVTDIENFQKQIDKIIKGN